MSSLPSFGLALPKAKKAKTDNTSTPVFGAAPKPRPIGNKARRKALLAASNDYDRDLDEGDDMDEKEWKVPENEVNRRKRKAGDEYDGEEEGDEEEDGNDDIRHDAQRGEEDEVSDEDLEDGEGEEQQVRGQGDKKKVQNNDLDGDTLNKRHRKAEGERLALRSLLDVEQGRRYDAFRVAVIPKPAIKRLNLQIYDQRINDNLAVLLAGMAKIFVADVVELAKDLQAHSKHPTGPLKPYHLRLARNLLEERGVLSGADHTSGGQTARKPKRPLFKR